MLKTITFLYIEQDVFSNMKDYYGVEIFETNKLSQEKYQRYLSYIVLNNMLLGTSVMIKFPVQGSPAGCFNDS